jgi:hypothetical protein
MDSTDSKKAKRNIFRQYLGRHIVLGASLVLLAAFFILREIRPAADFAATHIAQPWHRIAGSLFDIVPFSVAELVIAVIVIGALVFVVHTIVMVIRKKDKLRRAYGSLSTLLAGALTIYMLICWLWGIGYYSYTVPELSGIETREVSVEELKEVTTYFAHIANAAGEQVDRDENGIFTCDTAAILKETPVLFANLPEGFEFLEGPGLHPKPLFFSYIMSHMNFTGVFFPPTGEANLNVHSPDCFIPSAAAHELAHQRGVYREQDANFIAVLVCMESNNADFVYSGALLAYTHLSNALWRTSQEDWAEVRLLLSENVVRDYNANREYWAQFETPAAEASASAYEGFLHSQGQELGMRSYGACVDLLIAHYGEAAKAN